MKINLSSKKYKYFYRKLNMLDQPNNQSFKQLQNLIANRMNLVNEAMVGGGSRQPIKIKLGGKETEIDPKMFKQTPEKLQPFVLPPEVREMLFGGGQKPSTAPSVVTPSQANLNKINPAELAKLKDSLKTSYKDYLDKNPSNKNIINKNQSSGSNTQMNSQGNC